MFEFLDDIEKIKNKINIYLSKYITLAAQIPLNNGGFDRVMDRMEALFEIIRAYRNGDFDIVKRLLYDFEELERND